MPEDSVPADVRESMPYRCRITVADYEGEIDSARLDELEPIRVVETDNMLMNGGASVLWQTFIGAGTATAGQVLTYFNNANAAIGAGNSTAVEANTQTNLQGASRLRKGMNSGYPQHTDGTTTAARTISYQSTFGTADANFDWAELGLFNSATDAAGRMLNRKVQAMGVKTSSVSRVVTVDLSYNT